jgi:hypothetical protein
LVCFVSVQAGCCFVNASAVTESCRCLCAFSCATSATRSFLCSSNGLDSRRKDDTEPPTRHGGKCFSEYLLHPSGSSGGEMLKQKDFDKYNAKLCWKLTFYDYRACCSGPNSRVSFYHPPSHRIFIIAALPSDPKQPATTATGSSLTLYTITLPFLLSSAKAFSAKGMLCYVMVCYAYL